jgi:FMN phosphatase YigB (HAD superfamily)
VFDWESGIWLAFQPLFVENPHLQIDQNQVLAVFAELENEIQSDQPGMPYPEILKSIHNRFALRHDLVTNEGMDKSFGTSVGEWPAFPDSIEALVDLKKRYKLAILSNVDDVGFAASNGHLAVEFDAIYTAEKIGTYKPDAANFEFLFTQLLAE